MSPDLSDRYHRELASLQEWIDADEAAIAESERIIKAEQARVKKLRKNITKRREGWDSIYRAFLRRDAELPPHQPDLFGPDPLEEDAGDDDDARPGPADEKSWPIYERSGVEPDRVGLYFGHVEAADAAGALAAAVRRWPNVMTSELVVGDAGETEADARVRVEADQEAMRRRVPPSAADREPVRVAKGSPRAAAGRAS